MGSRFSLTVSSSKTKPGRLAEDSDREPIDVDGGRIECVKELPSLIAD